jgi:hypothetical protein
MSKNQQITIEGYTDEELLDLPEEQVDAFVLCNAPVAFRVGSAEILGQFKINETCLVVELAHIDGGGEGVLPTIWSLAERYAAKKDLEMVEWIVHAVHCAKPNLKLRRILELKGFTIENMAGIGETYHYVHEVAGRAV